MYRHSLHDIATPIKHLVSRLRQQVRFGLDRRSAPSGPASGDTALADIDRLSIPVVTNSIEETNRQDAIARGQFLARQERWPEFAGEFDAANAARLATKGGMPIADLLVYGARADAVQAIQHALHTGKPAPSAPIDACIAALEDVYTEHPGNPAVALVLATTHMDAGWSWRGGGWDATIPRRNREQFHTHFDRAREIMDGFCGVELDSPSIAAACCTLLAGDGAPADEIADAYEDLIDLDPRNFRHMRVMGHHLLPRHESGYQRLELEARRTAARTQDIWGSGAYSWVMFDAIAIDERACALVDLDFFLEGLRDIVERRPTQEMINLLAAYCSLTIRHGQGLSERADLKRLHIADCAGWLIREHLTEIHPLLWAHAAEGFDNNLRITSVKRFANSGRLDALRAIADQFRPEIELGHHVTFTPEGPIVEPC